MGSSEDLVAAKMEHMLRRCDCGAAREREIIECDGQ
jgi:hypothetical protein